MAEATALSDRLESVLRTANTSALKSYLEAKDDLLAIHEFKLSKNLKRLLSKTNPIESLNSIIEEDRRRVKHWKGSGHFQRWLAIYCLNSEGKMRKVNGYNGLPALWVEIRNEVKQKSVDPVESSEEAS